MYGYNDNESGSALQFGLNKAVMTKFEYNPNGGKDGAAQECLDISFEVNGVTKSYRQFPVTKAYDKGVEITDPKHPAMKKEFNSFNAKLTQLMKCFVTEEELKSAMMNITSFKSFCSALADVLPSNYSEVELDIFCQYQYQAKEDKPKFVEIPKDVKQGKVFVPHVEGDFTMITINSETNEFVMNGVTHELKPYGTKEYALELSETLTINVPKDKGILFVNESGELHPISRTAWFAASNWAKAESEDAPIQSNWE